MYLFDFNVCLLLRPGPRGGCQCRHEYPWGCDCGMWCVPLCVGAGAPCGVHVCWEGVMVRAWLPPLLPHPWSHLALINGSLGREPRFRIQENVPGSGHCAGPCSGSPSGNCSRREGESVEIGLREEGVALGSPLHWIKQDKLMGSSGQPGTWMLLPKSFNAGKLKASKRVPFLVSF